MTDVYRPDAPTFKMDSASSNQPLGWGHALDLIYASKYRPLSRWERWECGLLRVLVRRAAKRQGWGLNPTEKAEADAIRRRLYQRAGLGRRDGVYGKDEKPT